MLIATFRTLDLKFVAMKELRRGTTVRCVKEGCGYSASAGDGGGEGAGEGAGEGEAPTEPEEGAA